MTDLYESLQATQITLLSSSHSVHKKQLLKRRPRTAGLNWPLTYGRDTELSKM